jgi:hypothetical protein
MSSVRLVILVSVLFLPCIVSASLWSWFTGKTDADKTEQVTLTKLTQQQERVAAIKKWNPSSVTAYFAEKSPGLLSETCVTDLAYQMPTRCTGMREVDIMRFAIALTNCHLLKAGKPGLTGNGCSSRSESISQCTRGMSDALFNVYTTFYTQALALCVHLQHDMRTLAAEETISELIVASDRTVSQMRELREEASSMNRNLEDLGELAETQMHALVDIGNTADGISVATRTSLEELGKVSVAQRQMTDSLVELSKNSDVISRNMQQLSQAQTEVLDSLGSLVDSARKAKEQQEELLAQQKQMAVEQARLHEAQRSMVSSLDIVIGMAEVIFGGVTDLRVIVWYALLLFVTVISTLPVSTREARPTLLISVCVLLLIERVSAAAFGRSMVFDQIFTLVKKIFFFYAGGILMATYFTHTDYSKEDHRYIMQIHTMMNERRESFGFDDNNSNGHGLSKVRCCSSCLGEGSARVCF